MCCLAQDGHSSHSGVQSGLLPIEPHSEMVVASPCCAKLSAFASACRWTFSTSKTTWRECARECCLSGWYWWGCLFASDQSCLLGGGTTLHPSPKLGGGFVHSQQAGGFATLWGSEAFVHQVADRWGRTWAWGYAAWGNLWHRQFQCQPSSPDSPVAACIWRCWSSFEIRDGDEIILILRIWLLHALAKL